MIESQPVLSTGGSSGTVMLMLSLNLILLAFFILLNSLAMDSEAKAAVALTSIKQGFVSKDQGVNQGDADALELMKPWQQGVVSGLQGVVHNTLQISTPMMRADASQIMFELPLSAVFLPQTAELLPSGKALVANMVQLAQDKHHLPLLRMAWVIYALPGNTVLAQRQVLAIHDALREAEADATAVVVGVAIGEKKEGMTLAMTPTVVGFTQLGGVMERVGKQGGQVGAGIKALGKSTTGTP